MTTIAKHAATFDSGKAPTERTREVDHGFATTSWSPEDGGTLHYEADQRNMAPLGIASGLGIATIAGGLFAGSRAAKSARVAATAAGIGADDALKLARSASSKWVVGGSIAALGIALGGAILADRSSKRTSGTQSTTWDEYRDARLDDPSYQRDDESFTRVIAAQGLGIGAGMLAAAGAGRLLSGAPRSLQVIGSMAGLVGGMVGGTYASHQVLKRVGI